MLSRAPASTGVWSHILHALIAQGEKKDPDMEITGVFGNARYDDVRGAIPRQVFISMDAKINFVNSLNVYAWVIRTALGAERSSVVRLVMWETLPMIAIGIATGLLCGRYVETQLSE